MSAPWSGMMPWRKFSRLNNPPVDNRVIADFKLSARLDFDLPVAMRPLIERHILRVQIAEASE